MNQFTSIFNSRCFVWIFTLALSLFASSSYATIKAGTASFVSTSADTTDFLSIPPFLERATGKPSVVLAFDISGSMLVPAYPESGTSWSGGVMDNFDPAKTYFGYFDSSSQYEYDLLNGVFKANGSLAQGDLGAWDGNFMNWLTMRRVDVARQVMVGGKVRDRDGELIDGATKYVLEAEVEVRTSDDYTKRYSLSGNYSAIPNGTDIRISQGKIKAGGSGSGTASVAQVSDKFEVGYYEITSWAAAQEGDPTTWPQINFQNTYTDPVVVVTSLTFDGPNSTVGRASNVTSTGFRLGMQEWDAWDGAHTSEEMFYMVAERGTHTISITDSGGTDHTVNVVAGSVTSNKLLHRTESENNIANYELVTFPASTYTSTPAVFAGVSSLNNLTPNYVVAARPYDITNTMFKVTMQEQDTTSVGTHHSPDEIHYIALDKLTGTTATGVTLDVGDVTNVAHNPTSFNYNETFGSKPAVNFSPQTLNGKYAISVRVENDWDTTGADIMIKRSLSDTTAATPETISYMAVSAADGYNIHIAVDSEPTGLVQDNESSVNFGLSVYNFDKKTNDVNGIVTGNKVHGGTMHPCYWIYDPARRAKREAQALTDSDMTNPTVTLYNGSTRDYICAPTGVHAPNDKIVQVIEEYPLIWGTTPIAESLVDIGRYVKQTSPQYETVSSNSSDNKRVGNDPYGIYDTGNSWDPFYDTDQNKLLECKKVFVLHFNDGAPYTDYDGSSGHSTAASDLYDIANDNHTQNEALDNVALALRHNDCRNDIANHQEVISYFVYAALGADEQSNTSTRRMREAAARGGFIDEDGDNLPDPMHPTNAAGTRIDFNAYKALNSTPGLPNPTDCPQNEWDSDSDCEPDTFFLALDGAEIQDRLQKALNDILARVSSGGAASVISNTTGGEGAIYQASFSPSVSESGDTVKWSGDVAGLMIDQNGLVRSDDGDNVLEATDIDLIYDSCYDETQKQVRVKLSDKEADRPSDIDADNCSASVYTKSLDDVGYLWSAGDMLSALTDAQAITQRATYGTKSKNRYIFTSLLTDPDGDGAYNMEVKDFVPASFGSDQVGMLNTATTADAEKVINFIRGQDQAGMRTRQLNGKTMRLGDIIYSTPQPVGRPAESLDLLYDDDSYLEFFRQYRDRRTVVYVGGNDGMLHAFNAGWFDKTLQKFYTPSGDWDLGQEMWAYVPYNLLPHLNYLTNTDYGSKDGDHAYFVDQTPYIFDAQIFGSGGVTGQPDVGSVKTHPGGWGTVLVVGFRSGGGEVEVYPNPSDTTRSVTARPAYLIFDITDPEQAPKLLAEFSHADLGQTMSVPTALTVNRTSGGVDWYLAFGSGPTANANGHLQAVSETNAKVFMYNLKSLSLENGFGVSGVLDTGESNSFVGDLVAWDVELDVQTNAVYFGTTKGIDSVGADGIIDDWGGKLFRLRIESGTSSATHKWKLNEMIDAGSPILSRPSVALDDNDNRWLSVGTGRFLTVEDTIDNTARKIISVKEPRDVDGSFDMDQFSNNPSKIAENSLVDVTNARVTEGTGDLNNSVSISLTEDTLAALEQRHMQYEDGGKWTTGWVRYLGSGERAMGGSTLLGGIMTQTTYTPELVPCSFIGDSYIYALNYITGTASSLHIFGDPNTNVNNNDVLDRVHIGVTPSLAPGIHLGTTRKEGEAKVINLNSDMSMTMTTEKNLKNISSKETSWREM